MESQIRYCLIIITCCFQLTACATVEPNLYQDRYEIMTIDLPGSWHDVTGDYLNQTKAVLRHKHVEPDPGIKSLFAIDNHKGVYCKFRELRYTPNETGYKWGLERLATEIAILNNRVLEDYDITDYLEKGVSVTINQRKAVRTELISSYGVKINLYDGWKTTYNHWFEGNYFDNNEILTTTYVISSKLWTLSWEPKYYIVAECSIVCGNNKIEQTEKDIFSILNTIHLTGH